jgi:hypothetical protein
MQKIKSCTLLLSEPIYATLQVFDAKSLKQMCFCSCLLIHAAAYTAGFVSCGLLFAAQITII